MRGNLNQCGGAFPAVDKELRNLRGCAPSLENREAQ